MFMIKTHKRLVRLLCLLLVVALMPLQVTASGLARYGGVSATGGASRPAFTDVSPHAWYYPYVAGAICSGAHGRDGK